MFMIIKMLHVRFTSPVFCEQISIAEKVRMKDEQEGRNYYKIE